MENKMDTLTEVIEFLRVKFNTFNFELENEFLQCKETGESFRPDELTIVKSYRFEGDSSADDMSILYHLVSKSGTNGILINAFGIYSNPQLDEFIKKIPGIKSI